MSQTSITLLLDRSGSMNQILEDTLGGYNSYKNGLKGIDALFSLITFDSIGIDKIHLHLPINDVPDLTRKEFIPRGNTPLLDAAMKTIQAVERAVSDKPDTKVVITILTDGEENDSKLYAWLDLEDTIRRKQELGWQFVFLGAGINAYKQAGRMGISAGQTVSYDSSDRVSTQSVFEETAANTRAYASGEAATMEYTTDQKAAAKDAYIPMADHAVWDLMQKRPAAPKPAPQPLGPVQDFDL
jgi:uncharacterized protein YegL